MKKACFFSSLIFIAPGQLSSLGCDDFSKNIQGCSPYSCEEKHPVVEGAYITRSIKGWDEEAGCHYQESVEPNVYSMDCYLKEEEQISLSEIHQEVRKKIFQVNYKEDDFYIKNYKNSCHLSGHFKDHWDNMLNHDKEWPYPLDQ